MSTTMSGEERAARAYDLRVAEGIRRGLAQFDEGEFVSREESRAGRNGGEGAGGR